ncbi:DUF397 domain-containing protein [Actinopolyspora erythraea]|uniref:DUF397 domain-containing protein n=1 Tax=Actinopolyspora erythraea TaxID=414996 RepID=UPI0027E421CD|nr:DUF397 domain-containing protein [Actinopolyspora erythraea]
MADLTGVTWRESSRSRGADHCAEVGFATRIVGVRDTKDRAGRIPHRHRYTVDGIPRRREGHREDRPPRLDHSGRQPTATPRVPQAPQRRPTLSPPGAVNRRCCEPIETLGRNASGRAFSCARLTVHEA